MAQKLGRNYRYFRQHFSELAARHGGRIVVIAGGRLLGACPKGRSRELARIIKQARVDRPDEVPLVTPVPTLRQLANPLLL